MSYQVQVGPEQTVGLFCNSCVTLTSRILVDTVFDVECNLRAQGQPESLLTMYGSYSTRRGYH